ncbi:FAD-dependent oxidoreductase [Streptomyces sp. NPDC006670]|uniref:NAD(P)/FAD-dependent oxidoreductase n=1 Tax=Streptomyces sp. NPDC006670 TaxID=3154476 RepID=UPI003408E86C
MSRIVIAGGGFAGVWAAKAAARIRHQAGRAGEDVEITLIAPGEDLVIRPRLYEAAPERMRVPLDGVLAPLGVRRLRAEVADVDLPGRRVLLAGPAEPVPFDRLVLATGSRVRKPALPGAGALHYIDTLDEAHALDRRLRSLAGLPDAPGRFTVVVVGSGLAGVELAGTLPERLAAYPGARIVLVEREELPAPGLGDAARPLILDAFARAGAEWRTGCSPVSYDGTTLGLSDGTALEAATVVWTGGLGASPLTARFPGPRDGLGRLLVDEQLRLPEAEGVFAAGDTAAAAVEDGRTATQSCQYAIPSGATAGHNAVADLTGEPVALFRPDPYVTCVDLGPSEAVLTTGWDRALARTGADAKGLKQHINTRLIYP